MNRVLASKIVESLSAQVEPDVIYEELKQFGTPILPHDLLRRVVTRRSYGISFPSFADEDLLAVTLMDTFARVVNYWRKLSWLLEIAYFIQLRNTDDDFWEIFYRRIADSGKLPDIADLVFSFCASIFGVNLPEPLLYRISRSNPALRLWARHYGKKWALAEYPGSKLSLLVQSELIHDQLSWKRLKQRKLFPLLSGRTVEPDNAASATQGQSTGKMSRVIDRMRFHGPATYAYLRELPRWNRLLAQGD